MDGAPSNAGGWRDSLRRICQSLSALLRNRLELFAVELQEEKLRLLSLLVWLGMALVIGVLGLFIGLTALALWLWATAGYVGLVGLAVAALAVAGGILAGVRQKIKTGPPPFAQTVAEFRKDGECWHGNN